VLTRSLTTIAVLATAVLGANGVHAQGARDYIYIVGSSTVYPFATTVAERFGRTTKYPTPKVESTGSGGGMKLFCQGVGVEHPDITNASRRVKASEVAMCQENGVDKMTEVKIGYDGIVLANRKDQPQFDLSRKDIYLALANKVPDPEGGEKLVKNPYKHWNEVNADLPDQRIEVLGPPPTSGTRDAFAELALEAGCKEFDFIKQMKEENEDKFKRVCHTVREDGAYIDAGENDNLIVQKLEANPQALGVFGFSFLDQNRDKIQGARIGGAEPKFEKIKTGEYPLSRPLFFYVKNAHVGNIPGMREYIDEFTSAQAWGPDGYLVDKGLIPMPEEEREQMKERAQELQPLDMAELKQK
jgi:phosphate transport system substrate-binding protein